MRILSELWFAVATIFFLLSFALGSLLSDAVDEFKQYQTCYKDFFRRTPEKFETSGAFEFYNDTYFGAKTTFPEDFERLGEVRVFAERVANAHGFKCTSQTAACEEFPTCPEVVRFSMKFTTPEYAFIGAQKVMLSLDKINAINKYFYTLKVSPLHSLTYQANCI